MACVTAISSVWNGALWVKPWLRMLYPHVSALVIDEVNWTSDDTRWAGDTSPDGTAELIRSFPDPEGKIHFRQLGRWQHGCLAARADLCARIPKCDWVYVADVDEFLMEKTLKGIVGNLDEFSRQGYTTISQHVRSFYWDFQHHTNEGFTRWFKWYPGINCWGAHYSRPKDFSFPKVERQETPPLERADNSIYHYSYVPPPGVEIKGAMTFDVPTERYQIWYREVFRKFTGENLDEVQARNGGGSHVFGGFPVHEYLGLHPEVLNNHPLRHAVWIGDGYTRNDGKSVELKGWWNRV